MNELRLVIERDFDASLERVWQMWTDPQLIAKWSCPYGFTITRCDGELRVGGEWHSTMVSPDGFEMPLSGCYKEIVPMTKLVSSHLWQSQDAEGEETEYMVELTANDKGGTHMTFTQTGFTSVESKEGHEGGWGQVFGKLGNVLLDKSITIVREIHAPIERVFDAWITPADVVKWYYASEGWTTLYAEINAIKGGRFKIAFQNPEGVVVFDFTGTYTEVDRPTRIAYMMDDARSASIDFEAVGDKTKVTLVFGMESMNSEELQRDGWGGQVNHLVAYLEKEGKI